MKTTFTRVPNRSQGVRRVFRQVKICVYCRRGFECFSNVRKRCYECSGRVVINDHDKKVIAEYESYCRRIGLGPALTFKKLVMTQRGKLYYHLKIGYGITDVVKDRYIFIIRKFTEDIKAGKYDIVLEPFVYCLNYRKKIVRRMTPRPRVCPRHISSCIGSLFPGDCPRNFSQCEMSRKVVRGKFSRSGDLDSLVRQLVDNERSYREAGLGGRFGSSEGVGGGKNGNAMP